MAPELDPYRTLGLDRGASLDDVKRAYRRLAKANHPDRAGEAALPRFLAIHAAYDQIARPGANGGAGRRAGTSGGGAPRPSWEADPDRAGATHRAYGGRGRRTRTTRASGSTAAGGGSGPTPRSPGAGASGAGGPTSAGGAAGTAGGAGATGSPGTAGPAGGDPAGTTRPPRSSRPSNKATLGSTSYDGADAEPFEPDWGGASWYGTTSGTYWTLNPKEYADPRKHGPEYQARARRGRRGDPLAGPGVDGGNEPAAPGRSPGATAAGATGATTSGFADGEAAADLGTATADAPASGETNATGGPTTNAGAATAGPPPSATGASLDGAATASRPAPRPTHTTSSWWEATAGTATEPGDAKRPAAPAAGDRGRDPGAGSASGESSTRAAGAATGAPDLERAASSVRAWLDGTDTGLVGRVARAVIGWAPIALGIGWLAGEISGCARFSAGCDDGVAPIAWLAQVVVLVLLLVVPRLALIAATATAVTLAAAVPGALLLSATGGSDNVAFGRMALGGLLVIAWIAGVLVGAWREVRRARAGRLPGAGPVS